MGLLSGIVKVSLLRRLFESFSGRRNSGYNARPRARRY